MDIQQQTCRAQNTSAGHLALAVYYKQAEQFTTSHPGTSRCITAEQAQAGGAMHVQATTIRGGRRVGEREIPVCHGP